MALLIHPRHIVAAAAVCLGLAQAPAARAGDFQADAQRVSRLERQMAAATAQLPRLELAQLARPPGVIPGADDEGDAVPPREDATGLDLRVDRLENQMRTLNGQIEQTQFQIRHLEEELRTFQQQVDLRSPDAGRPRGPQKRSDAGDQLPPIGAEASAAPEAPPGRVKRGDAFDPNAQPGAPGAPRELGSLPAGPVSPDAAPTRPVGDAPPVASNDQEPYPSGPLDLSRAGQVPPMPDELAPPARVAPPATSLPGPSTVAPGMASLPPTTAPSSPREDFELAISRLKQGQYETAQTGFEAFLQKYPKDRLVADAVYYLGETYTQRGRYREAAEQYLKVATDYSKSPRAPEGLVRLGMSLNALGAKEQACATFGEVSRKYPNASAAVKNSVDRETKRAKC